MAPAVAATLHTLSPQDISSRHAFDAGERGAAAVIREGKLPPGPPLPTPLHTYLTWQHTVRYFAAARLHYGPVFTIKTLPWGAAVVVADPELIKQVFTGEADLLHAGDGNAMLAPVLGERSVLVLDEDEHLQTRKRLLPPFHGEAVRRYESTIREVFAEEIERWPLGRPFALHPRMRAATFEVILRTVIGVTDSERADELRRVLPRTAAVDPATMVMWEYPGLGRFGKWRRYKRTLAEANELLRSEIADRRVDPDLASREDVLSHLVLANELDDEELRDQIMTLLMAGHETSATGLAWAFERLLRHPDILGRAEHAEPEYLDAVVTETLRVRPVIAAVLRQLQRPMSLGEHDLPAGVTLMPSVTLLHNDEALYRNPEQFRPERVLEGNCGGTYTWIPFGGGRRRCLGAAFALTEMRVALETILQHARLRADRPNDERIKNHHITLVPARGTRVIREA